MTNDKPVGVAFADPALDGATIDNSIIGGSTPNVGAFTSISSTLGVTAGTSSSPIATASGSGGT